MVLMELGKIYHITFPNVPTCLNRTNKKLSGHWKITTAPASKAAGAQSSGWTPPPSPGHAHLPCLHLCPKRQPHSFH